MPITAIYAAVLALFYIGLSYWVIRQRWACRVGLGHREQPKLLRAIRIHGNFQEYVPFCLVLMMLLEVQIAETTWIHGLGMALVIARAFHLWGLFRSSRVSVGRIIGTCLTFLVLFVAALAILFHKA